MSDKESPHIIGAIKMLRDLRNWSLERARDHAIEEYRRKGWHIPPSIEAMYGKHYGHSGAAEMKAGK